MSWNNMSRNSSLGIPLTIYQTYWVEIENISLIFWICIDIEFIHRSYKMLSPGSAFAVADRKIS